jgi:hypothetical protein
VLVFSTHRSYGTTLQSHHLSATNRMFRWNKLHFVPNAINQIASSLLPYISGQATNNSAGDKIINKKTLYQIGTRFFYYGAL